ncbi:MAG: site-2 protease family protein [Actinomycetota bacterium]|nr:site-2 protease family protein [Actinomycetota bacterium]MDQ3926229.1 site-2 protease family protein [Actinomycetota bacterium]
MFLQLFEQDPVGAVAFLLGILAGIVVHEASHACSAYALGDDTAYHQGRVTLNPTEHLDVLGTLMILMAGIGWGKPTPVTPSKLKGGVWGPVAVAGAGPVSNLLVVVLCGMLFWLPPFGGEYLFTVVWYLALANGLLFVLNLIPIPPLDGAAILYPFLPRSLDSFVSFMYQYGPMILIGLVLLSIFLPGLSPLSFILALVGPLFDLLGLPLMPP